jgi:cell division protein FtsB
VSDWFSFRKRPAAPPEHELTDARLVPAHARRRELDPELRGKLKLRRRAWFGGLAAIAFAGTLAALIGEGGHFDARKLRREIVELEQELAQREAAIARLDREVNGLQKDPLLRERVAREQLGMVQPGEIDFLLPREDALRWEPPPASQGPRATP